MDKTAHPAHSVPLAASASAPAASPRRPSPPVECLTRLRAVAARVAACEAARAMDGADVRVAAPDGALDDHGQEALGAACRAARECGLHGEHVVLALKDVWRTLPEAQRLARRDAEAALARLVTACITAFYLPANARPQARPQARIWAPTQTGAPHGLDTAWAVRPTF